MLKWFGIAFIALGCSSAANAQAFRCPNSPTGWCMPAPVPVARPLTIHPQAVQYERHDEERPEIYRGPCPRGEALDKKINRCLRKLTAHDWDRLPDAHMDSDPHCGPGKSGTLYQTVETLPTGQRAVLTHRCR